MPIRLVHDRWISKFAEPVVDAMSAIKAQLESPMDTIDHIYSVYKSAEAFAGGIVYIVSGLKTLIETGQPLTAR